MSTVSFEASSSGVNVTTTTECNKIQTGFVANSLTIDFAQILGEITSAMENSDPLVAARGRRLYGLFNKVLTGFQTEHCLHSSAFTDFVNNLDL